MIRLQTIGLSPWLDSLLRTTLKYPDSKDGRGVAVTVQLYEDPRLSMDESGASAQPTDATTIRVAVPTRGLMSTDPEGGQRSGKGAVPPPRARAVVNRWIADVSQHIAETCARRSLPLVRIATWPGGRRFAACLTHDVDQIYDRELFRLFADLNHLLRLWFAGERGRSSACVRRIARSLAAPKDPIEQFRSIRRLERRYGWPSTFFFMRDRYWARFGARYGLEDRPLRRIVTELIADGCELGVHGSYYHHDDVAWLQQSIHEFERSFGYRVEGVRNHYLQLTIPTTWEAQQAAGLEYDATFGSNTIPGPRSGIALPFFPLPPAGTTAGGLLEIPLTIMDGTLFRWLALDGERALELTRKVVMDASAHGGLVTLLWHNNYFDEPEYSEWPEVFAALLELLAQERAVVMTARNINDWWRARANIELHSEVWSPGWWTGRLRVGSEIDGLTLELRGCDHDAGLEIIGGDATVERGAPTMLHFRHLEAGQQVVIKIGTPDESPG